MVVSSSVGRSRASLLMGENIHEPLSRAFDRAIDEIARDARFSTVEIVQHAVRGSRLSLTIDREGGIDVGTCERIASAINAQLAGIDAPYALEVESAGLSRPLTKPGDYQRFAGRDAKVVTTLAVHGSKTHRGVLRGVRGNCVILETPGGELPLPLATIKAANLEYDIRPDLRRDKKERKHHA